MLLGVVNEDVGEKLLDIEVLQFPELEGLPVVFSDVAAVLDEAL